MAMQAGLSEQQKVALWFVRVRWGAILTILIIILYDNFIGHLSIAILPSLALVALAAAYNLAFPLIIRRFPPFSARPIFTYARMLADISIITLIIHFSGGVESPFVSLYLVEVAAVAIFGFYALAYLMAGHAAALFTLVSHLEAIGFIHHYRSIPDAGQLYLNLYYVYSRVAAIFFTSLLAIYMASYLSDRLRDKQKQVEDLSAARIDFMNMVVHELRNPLTGIMGYLSLCGEGLLGPLNEKQKEAVEALNKQTRRLVSLTEELLNVARLESGLGKFEKRPVQVEKAADEALADFDTQLAQKKIKIVKMYGAHLPPVTGDHDKLLEVFANLLANALKYSNEGGHIYLSISRETEMMKISVRDEGKGISPEDLPNIFRKFYRSAHADPGYKGTGLGLSICRSIIERHGGEIRADSPGLGQGSTFTFTLPLK